MAKIFLLPNKVLFIALCNIAQIIAFVLANIELTIFPALQKYQELNAETDNVLLR